MTFSVSFCTTFSSSSSSSSFFSLNKVISTALFPSALFTILLLTISPFIFPRTLIATIFTLFFPSFIGSSLS